MQTTIPLYGFGGGGGTGATLTVMAPAGCTVTVSKDGKTKTKTAGADGVAVFKGLATGEWTVTITDGEQTAQKTVTITADYSAAITFFAATIHVTYPAGSVCTTTDGTTTLTAPDTSGTWDCVVPNAGTWTVSLDSGFAEAVEITDNGAEKTINQWHLYNLGDECTSVTGGWISSGSYQGQPLAEPIRNEDNIQCNGKGGYKVGVITTKATPFSGFSKLYAEVIVSSYDSTYDASLDLSICNKDTRNEIAHVSAGPVSASLKTITLSIESTIDSACVLVYAPSTPSAQGKTYRIWLEV